MTSRTVNPPRAIVPPGGPSRGRQAYRYSIHEHETQAGTRWSIGRAHLKDYRHWSGRGRGWTRVDSADIPKLYSRYGGAYRALRKLQAEDAEVSTAAGRKRRLERMAPELLEALRAVLDRAEGVDMARATLARVDRILNRD